ncbi:hypothetical protein KO495_10360 [Colwellia sp. D2M02]|uniref:hypothetical protein n=1 Tax=Colwellia sp. D2M02 TaxID=2841562 RepID=UPI001C082446|nr:hypothetical protein [Colwellia sp. D2M02]MBU2893723.1 hypothetical protein [Colwellia sp. D2M02]
MEVIIDILAPLFYDQDPRRIVFRYIVEGTDVNIGDILFTVEIASDYIDLYTKYPNDYSSNYLEVRAEYKGFIYAIEVDSGDIINSNQVVMKISRQSERFRSTKVIKFFFVLGSIFILHALSGLYFGEMFIGSKVDSGGSTVTGSELYLFVFVQISWGVGISLWGFPTKYPKNIDDKVLDSLSLEDSLKLDRKLNYPRAIVSGILMIGSVITLFTYAFIN